MFQVGKETLDDVKTLLAQTSLMNTRNYAKAKVLSVFNELPTLMEVLAQCQQCDYGRYTINQTCYDKLVSLVKTISVQNNDDDGLIRLAASGLLNEETIELFAANPSAFTNEAVFSDEGGDLRIIVEGIIQQQSGLKFNP